jgi:hypothetical protein
MPPKNCMRNDPRRVSLRAAMPKKTREGKGHVERNAVALWNRNSNSNSIPDMSSPHSPGDVVRVFFGSVVRSVRRRRNVRFFRQEGDGTSTVPPQERDNRRSIPMPSGPPTEESPWGCSTPLVRLVPCCHVLGAEPDEEPQDEDRHASGRARGKPCPRGKRGRRNSMAIWYPR